MKKSIIAGLSFLALCNFAVANDLKLESDTLKPDGKMEMAQVFNSFGCTGKNISPELHWSGAPAGTKAFALTMYDPDAPTGSGWWHWVVFNIPAKVNKLELGASGKHKMPKGAVESRTDFGKPGYGGPCPPKGDSPHHYIFHLYALKSPITLTSQSPAAMVGFYAGQGKLAEASFTVTFGR